MSGVNQVVQVVVAHDQMLGIGLNNGLPWPSIALDMKHFRALTEHGTVIMGRKTWDSIPEKFRPLPNRKNIVLSREITEPKNAEVLHFTGLIPAVECALGSKGPVSIIGGGQIYEQIFEELGFECEVHATVVESVFRCDTFMPDYRKTFLLKSRTESFYDPQSKLNLHMEVWARP